MVDLANDFKEQVTELRRNQILMGAAQVFAEKGFHKATTKEVAKAAGVSEGTIYNYFDNKRELLVAMIELLAIQSLKRILVEPVAEEPEAFLSAIMHDRYQLAQERGHLIAPLMAEIFTDNELRETLYQQILLPTSSHLEKYLQTQLEAGRFRPLDPVIVTRALLGAILLNFAMKLTHLDSRYEAISVESMIDQITSLFLRGLTASDEAVEN